VCERRFDIVQIGCRAKSTLGSVCSIEGEESAHKPAADRVDVPGHQLGFDSAWN